MRRIAGIVLGACGFVVGLAGCATSLEGAPAASRYALFASVSDTLATHAESGATQHAEAHDGHGHVERSAAERGHAGHANAGRPLLRTDFGRGWSQDWEHAHASVRETPFVHGLFVEPAFLGREVFVTAAGVDGETTFEAEIEWALSRRIALIGELAYVDLDDESGIGDGAVAVRALLVETQGFLLSASAELELPIGDDTRGLGAGTTAAGVFSHAWMDMGSWFTLQTQIGVEHVFDEDETAFIWRAMLAKSFPAIPLIKRPCRLGEHDLDTWSLFVEVDAETPFDGDISGTWLAGFSYPLLRGYNIRAGYTRTFDGVDGWTVGLVLHP